MHNPLGKTITVAPQFTLYYTPVLRPNEAEIIQLVTLYLAIPPEQTAYPVDASCPAQCINKMFTNHTVYVTQIQAKMNSLGKH